MIVPVNSEVWPSGLSVGAGSWLSADTDDGLLDALTQSSNSEAQTQVSLSALGQLQAASDSFQDALAQLTPPDQTGSSVAGSSNPLVISANAQSNAPTGTYNITVTSLAQAQALQSASYATPDSTIIGSGPLTITVGSYDAVGNTFTPGPQAPATLILSHASLDDVASALNSAGAGVTAQAQPVSGGYALVISGTGTGTGQGFELQAGDPSLAGLSFDPTNPQASGLVETQAAQGGSLTVNGAPISSANNVGVSIAPGLSIDLLAPGSSVVTSTPSSASARSMAESLVSAFNAVQSALAVAQGADGEVSANVAGPYADALEQAATASYSTGDGQLNQLPQIGLNLQLTAVAGGAVANGLSLDVGSFDAAASTDPAGTLALLNAAVQAFITVAGSFGDAGGALDSTESAYQSALYSDQLIQPLVPQSALPSASQLAAVQLNADTLTPAQIQSEQQYARSVGPLLQTAWISNLLTQLYTPDAQPAALLSLLA